MQIHQSDYSSQATQDEVSAVASMLHSKYSAMETYDFLKRVLVQVCDRYDWVPHTIDIDDDSDPILK